MYILLCFFSSKISCSATLSFTAEVEEKQSFGVDEANLLIKDLQKVFNSGKTKSYEWRISQLQSIAKMLEEKEKDIIEAIHKDLAKPQLEAFISEVIEFYSFSPLKLLNSFSHDELFLPGCAFV